MLPNGHIFVFSGVMQMVPSIDVLGFLLGHECAHAVLRHGGERMSVSLRARMPASGRSVPREWAVGAKGVGGQCLAASGWLPADR